jgi:hypothetical protein
MKGLRGATVGHGGKRGATGVAGLLLTIATVAVAGCGGGDEAGRARALYEDYRAAEDRRDDAESRLRQAFSDIVKAAARNDRSGVLDAAKSGQTAAGEIERLLAEELEAARGLTDLKDFAGSGDRLTRGLEKTRQGLRLFAQELEIASDDPFLARGANADKVGRLAREGTELAVEGELAIRKADRALALVLGIEPRIDRVVDKDEPES